MNDYVVIVVVLICMAIGYILKELVPSKKLNNFIPLILGSIGVVLNVWYNEWTFTPEILLGGLASGLASTGTYEASTGIYGFVKNMIENYKGQ